MSTVKANNHQIGQSGTATNNFTLYQPSTPDGTVRLAVGNSGATTGDVLSVSNTGLSVTGTLSATGNVTLGDETTDTITLTGTVQPGVVISGSSSGDALRITQTGAGNALLVEDAANPDSSPFVVNASGNVGIGTSSPAQKLDVRGGSIVVDTASAGLNPTVFFDHDNFASGTRNFIQMNRSTEAMLFSVANADRMTIDSSGNLGLGVTPSAWASTYRAYQVGQAGSLFGLTNDQDRVGVSSNAYFDTTDSRWEYIGTGYAMRYDQNAGEHQWYTAASGAANGAITFTQAMTLDASGYLLVGTTTSPSQQAVIYRTSATTSNGALLLDGNGNYAGLQFASSGTLYGSLAVDSSALYLTHGSTLTFRTGATTNVGGTERARITSGGDFRVKGAGTAGSTDAFQVSGSAPADAARITSGGDLLVGGTTAYGQISATKSIAPAATPSSDWGIDFASSTAPPNYISLAASATYDLAAGSGFVILHNNNGDAAAFLTYGGVVTKLGGATNVISGTAGANQIGLAYNSGTGKYRISNGHSSTQNIFVTTIRTRTSS